MLSLRRFLRVQTLRFVEIKCYYKPKFRGGGVYIFYVYSLYFELLIILNKTSCSEKLQRGSFMVWKINMGVCPRLKFDNFMFINCLGYDFYVYGAFEFLCNSIADL